MRCFHRDMTVWRGHWKKVVLRFLFFEKIKIQKLRIFIFSTFYFFDFLFFQQKSSFYFFSISGAWTLWALYLYIKHQIPNVRLWLPKFDSKILISWWAFSSHLRPLGYRTPGHGRKIEKIKSNEKIKIKSRKNKKVKSCILFLFFQTWSVRRHPQRPEVLQYQGHVQPRRQASLPEPRPRLKQIT